MKSVQKRCKIIKMIIFAGFVAGSALTSFRGFAQERGDGRITFYTYYLKESETIRYRDGDRYLPEGLKEAEKLFRSRDSEALLPIDPKLLEIIDVIEDHFGVRQVEVISGYRSTAFNKELKATGHAVANESYHTKGMAADIHLDEIDEKTLRDYALSLGQGGVGYYGSLDFVHVDAGPVRTWGDDGPRKPWIGEKNETCPVTLTVAPVRLIGKKGLDSLKVEGGEIEPVVDIEFFDRGKWTVVGKVDARVPLSKQEEPFVDQSFGKFRLKAKVKGQADVFQFSNEFYFKRI
jgi:uncharacterized protein YcbK (DUF882 family)